MGLGLMVLVVGTIILVDPNCGFTNPPVQEMEFEEFHVKSPCEVANEEFLYLLHLSIECEESEEVNNRSNMCMHKLPLLLESANKKRHRICYEEP